MVTLINGTYSKHSEEKVSFNFDEFHGFCEVFEHVFSFFSDFVDGMASVLMLGYEALILQRVKNLRERLPGQVGFIHDPSGLSSALIDGFQNFQVYL